MWDFHLCLCLSNMPVSFVMKSYNKSFSKKMFNNLNQYYNKGGEIDSHRL